ncbi:MAG: UbiH/UbiF/VisC/COQ6 family ubiquinone biosynthesis hydroxylase [Gammaproteobacteria bacterium]|nr:UbiH/UbiF/VisC/COQ6 family ubiquinone biosynthesis hydroxylase [Gammaproteobacteria bacterium]MCH9745067.1 UbiH/UbiF/VisC/COQ6 family ubiquinone biosynthesis hydroxylase [Gammaproteobacteria bacterium]
MMDHKYYDVVIVGGGMVGLSLAYGLAQQSFRVAVVQDKAPELAWDEDDQTARVSAINLSSYDFLQDINVWSSPLKKMHVWSDDAAIDFDAMQIGELELGYIVENRRIVAALYSLLQKEDGVDLICPAKPKQYELFDNGVRLTLDDNVIDVKLLVGADGANSWLRQQMQVAVEQRPYDQDAIVAVVQVEKAHCQTAYQHFLPTGPIGVLPLKGSHQMAIVWSSDANESARLMNLSDKQFNFELTNALQDKLGFMRLLNQRICIPLVMRHARQYCQERCVLVGDAAHTIHPLAGQGVNCGFSDAMCLIDVLVASRDAKQFAAFKYLRRYERERKSQNALMINVMRGFKEMSATRHPLMTLLRSQGFKRVNQLNLLKQWFMRAAVGRQ